MKMNVKRTLGLLLIMAMVSVTALATPALAEELDITGTRTISVTEAAPGDTLTVTVEMQVTGDNATDRLINTQLAETVPFGWTVTENDSASMIFSGSTPNYAWQDTTGELAAGDILTIVYDVTIPELEEAGEKSITGFVSADRYSTELNVRNSIGGDMIVNVILPQHDPIQHLSPGDSLQEAVDNAEPGDTIMMAPGTYVFDTFLDSAALFITKTLHFEAEDGVVEWQGKYMEPWWGGDPYYEGGIFIGVYDDGSNYVASDDASGTTFKGITFGIDTEIRIETRDYGSYEDVHYENCTFAGGNSWIVDSNSSIINCTLSTGIDLDEASNVLIENNTGTAEIRDVGISAGGSNLTLRNNDFSNFVARSFISKYPALIENNRFGTGDMSSLTNSGNIIRYNEFNGSSSLTLGGQVYLNNFIDCAPTGSATFNTSEMVTYTYGGASHTGYLGNYYSGYAGNDTNRDGVGEDAHGDDIYPLMGEWNDGEIAYTLPPQPLLSFMPSDAEVIEGQTTGIVISADSLPEGLAGYNFTVTIDDPNVAEIVGIEYPAWVTLTENSSLPGTFVYLKALDGDEAVQAGATEVVLVTLTVMGKEAGNASFTLGIDRLDDDTGTAIEASLETGTLKVTSTPIPGQTASPRDLNGDGLYEDLTGDGTFSFTDVEVFFHQMDWVEANLPIENFDFNGNGRIDFDDIVDLFQMI